MLRAYRFSGQIADTFNKALKNDFQTLSEVTERLPKLKISGRAIARAELSNPNIPVSSYSSVGAVGG